MRTARLADGRTVRIDAFDPDLGGRWNTYVCRAGHRNLSVDLEDGTTPMFLVCRRMVGARTQCGAPSTSQGYPPGPPASELFPVRVVFRQPTAKELEKERRQRGGHYRRGGLALEWVSA